MKNFNEENASVNAKRKNISALVEYCIENKIEFSVKPLISRSEEFEVEFNLSNLKKSIQLGMFLKELRIELNGVQSAIVTPTAISKTSKKSSGKDNTISKEEKLAPITFEDSDLQFNLEATN